MIFGRKLMKFYFEKQASSFNFIFPKDFNYLQYILTSAYALRSTSLIYFSH